MANDLSQAMMARGWTLSLGAAIKMPRPMDRASVEVPLKSHCACTTDDIVRRYWCSRREISIKLGVVLDVDRELCKSRRAAEIILHAESDGNYLSRTDLL